MEFKIARSINFLAYRDITSLAVVFGKEYEDLWREVAYERWWGLKFWKKAAKRDPAVSQPRRNWRLEVLRNLEFEKEIYPTVWGELDYYDYWQLRERLE